MATRGNTILGYPSLSRKVFRMPDQEDQVAKEASQPTVQASSSNGDMAELRQHERYPFPAMHRIAPRHGVELPKDGDFFQVKFYDLSGGGFSFLLAGPPSFKQVVVALVIPKTTTFLGAEVAHFTAVRVSRSGSLERIDNEASDTKQESSLENGGRRMFLVGCRITERLGTKPTNRLWLTQ